MWNPFVKKQNFWQKLKKPIFVLAPMEGVTDSPFRRILVETGKPAVMFTEFTSVEGMFSPGNKQVTQRLKFEKTERPIVAQIWGLKPENFFKAGKEIVRMGFDGVDLNFGCPDRSVIKMGACSAMMQNDRGRVKEVLQAIKEGVSGKIPVSVKTRIGFREIATEEWAGFFLEQGVDALTIHGRTVRELSDVPCHWDEIGKVVKLRDKLGVKTLILGNGDVESLDGANEKVTQYGVDGVMIGRGIFHNPWLFDESVKVDTKSPEERLKLLLKHTRLFVETWGETKNFEDIKKYFKIYIREFPEASECRSRLMGCHNLDQVEKVVKDLQGQSLQDIIPT